MGAGELVRRLRARHGLTQRQLAVRAGTGQANISRIERGLEDVTVARLEQLLLCMGEQLTLGSRHLPYRGDPVDQADFRRLPMDRRLVEGLRFVRQASELYESGVARRTDQRGE